MKASPKAATILPFERPVSIPSPEPVRIDCHHDLAAIEGLWSAFQKLAVTSAYSSFQWCDAWSKTVGERLKIQPRIVVGYDIKGQVAFILPLQLRRRAGLQTLEFLGAPDMQCGFGLFHPEFLPLAPTWFEGNMQRVLASTGRHHVIALVDMPHKLAGYLHPLSRLFTVTCANDSFSLDLDPDYEAVYTRKRNSETRRANRRKDSRLAESGKVRFHEPETTQELHQVIDLMLEHKVKRLAENGIHGVFEQEEHRMVHMLADAEENGKRLFTTHVLSLDDDILAVTFGGWMSGTYWFYISSLAPDSAATKFSPGDFALRQTIKACCDAKLKTFDFGAGVAPYKVGWTDTVMNLQGIVLSNTLFGLPLVMGIVAKLNLLAVIKRNTWLRTTAFSIRKMIKGTAGKAA